MKRAQFDAEVEKMMSEANHGCGLSFELYESRLRGMVESFIANLSEDDKSYVLEKAGVHLDEEPEELACVLCAKPANHNGVYCTDCVL